MVVAQKLLPSSLIWKEGMAAWSPLAEVAALEQLSRAVPPKLPQLSARDQLISMPMAGAGRRFFARMIDLWAISLPVSLIVAFVLLLTYPGFEIWIKQPGNEYIFGWLLMPFVLLFEAGVFAVFGNTLGKALLGVIVITVDAQRLTAGQYLDRQLGLYWYGLGTGFPLVSLVTMTRQYGRLKSGSLARYDEGSFNVKASKLGVLRYAIAIFVLACILLINGALTEILR